jgi:hypothetical protein
MVRFTGKAGRVWRHVHEFLVTEYVHVDVVHVVESIGWFGVGRNYSQVDVSILNHVDAFHNFNHAEGHAFGCRVTSGWPVEQHLQRSKRGRWPLEVVQGLFGGKAKL